MISSHGKLCLDIKDKPDSNNQFATVYQYSMEK